MVFDKSKVYTAINADELKAGSKCIFADTLKQLKEKIHSLENIEELSFIANENEYTRFIAKDGYDWYFAYLVEEPTYRPYKDGDEAFLYLHDKWLINKRNKAKRRVTDIYSTYISLSGDDFYFNDLLQYFEIYSITGKNEPCGVKINGSN